MRSLFLRTTYEGKTAKEGEHTESDDARFQGRYTYRVNAGKQEIIVNKKHVNNDEESWASRNVVGVSAKLRRTRVVVLARSQGENSNTSPVKRVAEICIRHFLHLLWDVKWERLLPLVGATISQKSWAQHERNNSHDRRGGTTGTLKKCVDRRNTNRSCRQRRDKDREK